jgi:hypothetical protein
MKKCIVTTTINHVTEAVDRFQRMSDWELIVVGDKRTPADYKLTRGTYVGPEEQEKCDPKLSEAIGWNCIQRRNFGFLWAHAAGADIVAVVDDDNIPLEGWGQDLLIGRVAEVKHFETELLAFDPIGATNHRQLWHRGYPIQLVGHRTYGEPQVRRIVADVQADFWNGEPDIDAMCRMEHAPSCSFDPSCFPIASNRISPFNTQNTFIRGDLLKDFFLFPYVGRMDDIWASYYVQAKGAKVVYGAPSVYQQRNDHDLIEDMQLEYVGYENNAALLRDLQTDPESIVRYLPGRSAWAFQLYRRHFDNA